MKKFLLLLFFYSQVNTKTFHPYDARGCVSMKIIFQNNQETFFKKHPLIATNFCVLTSRVITKPLYTNHCWKFLERGVWILLSTQKVVNFIYIEMYIVSLCVCADVISMEVNINLFFIKNQHPLRSRSQFSFTFSFFNIIPLHCFLLSLNDAFIPPHIQLQHSSNAIIYKI